MGGISAAIEAARAGARVLVVDRAGRAPARRRWPAGTSTSAAVRRCSRRPATRTAPRRWPTYLRAVSPDADPEKIRLYCEDSVEHFDWIEGLGFQFERSYYAPKAVVQPGTEGLMYTGSEKAYPFRDLAKPAPRGHKPPFPGDTGGGGFVVDLALKRLDELGVEVRFDTGVTTLVVDGRRGRRRGAGSGSPRAASSAPRRWSSRPVGS